MSDFRVSVVIPLYNKAPFIRRTLKSALAQSHAAAEIIIVDDSSTDDSARAIEDLIGGSVRLVVQDNAGPGPARNRGINEAIYPWVAFLDGDDVWRPDHLATLGELSRRFQNAGALATSFEVARSTEFVAETSCTARETRGEILDYFNQPVGQSAVWTSCVAVKRSILQQSGGFGSFWPGEDSELWTRLALDHDFAVTKKCTAIYIQQTGGLMENWASQPGGFLLMPNFKTIERALSDPNYAHRHGDLLSHYRGLLKRNVRQSLYRGEVTVARSYIREIEKSGRAQLGILRPLSWLPATFLRLGIAARSQLHGIFK